MRTPCLKRDRFCTGYLGKAALPRKVPATCNAVGSHARCPRKDSVLLHVRIEYQRRKAHCRGDTWKRTVKGQFLGWRPERRGWVTRKPGRNTDRTADATDRRQDNRRAEKQRTAARNTRRQTAATAQEKEHPQSHDKKASFPAT